MKLKLLKIMAIVMALGAPSLGFGYHGSFTHCYGYYPYRECYRCYAVSYPPFQRCHVISSRYYNYYPFYYGYYNYPYYYRHHHHGYYNSYNYYNYNSYYYYGHHGGVYYRGATSAPHGGMAPVPVGHPSGGGGHPSGGGMMGAPQGGASHGGGGGHGGGHH